jgi:hypothetical protein
VYKEGEARIQWNHKNTEPSAINVVTVPLHHRPQVRTDIPSYAFGDSLFPCMVVDTLNANGIEAYYQHELSHITDLVDCKKIYKIPQNVRWLSGGYTNSFYDPNSTLHKDIMHEVCVSLGIDDLPINKNYIPVKFTRDPSFPTVDVVLVTEQGGYSVIREWDKFQELKKLLREYNFSYIDASEEGIRSNDLLNIVNNCKVYVGIDTGSSHYVSQVANGKAIIINSGYASFEYVFGQYNYDTVEYLVDCRYCIFTALSMCRDSGHDHDCMKNISTQMVFEKMWPYLIV